MTDHEHKCPSCEESFHCAEVDCEDGIYCEPCYELAEMVAYGR